jgi:hypothetical protein
LKQSTEEKRGHKARERYSALQIQLKEQELISFIRQNTQRIAHEYGITPRELLSSLSEKKILIPISAFLSDNCPLECVVKHLRDVEGLSINEIASLLKRDYTTIWRTYKNSMAKSPAESHSNDEKKVYKKLSLDAAEIKFPVEIFADSRLSVLESAVLFLKEQFALSLHEIASVMNRNDRTIWTVLHRAEVKQA